MGWGWRAAGLALVPALAVAQQVEWPSPRLPQPRLAVIGPYNAVFLAGGDGIARPAQGYTPGDPLPEAALWSLRAWVRVDRSMPGLVAVAGIGTAADPARRLLALRDGQPLLAIGAAQVAGGPRLAPGGWHHIAARVDHGLARLYVDGRPVAQGPVPETRPEAAVLIGPRAPGTPGFAGAVAGFVYAPGALGEERLAAEAAAPPDAALIAFEEGAAHWPLQVRTQYGQTAPQPAWTLPRGLAPPSRPEAHPVPASPALAPAADGWRLVQGWRMAAAPDVAADGARLSRAEFDAAHWLAATVPGTALTTLVDRGVYPDPRIGLNNLAIPERLAHQDYWYRSVFTLPATPAGRHRWLAFDGINYAAQIWVNGQALGTMKGAFARGRFDATALLRPGRNAVAVRVSPPPHPGLPHEQSMTAGRGENGGAMQIDGPTFSATESWDWIPGVRDRNTGLWQPVRLGETGALTLGDPQILTTLPEPDLSVAEVHLAVPVTNAGPTPRRATVRAGFDSVAVERTVRLAPGESVTVRFDPDDFPQLRVHHPRLWWPNGYGDPALHDLHLAVAEGDAESDRRSLRFGMRSLSYELSSLDSAGDLRRIEVDQARARLLGTPIIDERHASLRKVAGGWADSLFPGAERSPAVRPGRSDPRLAPHLVLRVNGVPIAARGGNWGMDEMMKRVDRARLEPYFRLHREAGLNIIRNWMGQSSEEAFYALADEYGLMVLNDFWESTQDNDAEAEDVPLFLANARDTIRRFRTHASIVLWIGRNEGVPQPILEDALQALAWEEDGTRLYKGNSRIINLAGSGPYDWRPPEGYFTDFAKGFAVEVGTPSFPTREAWARAIPAPDRWPINDSWAYHDWHQERAVAVTGFMDALATRFGAAANLADFERKAQMLNYESYRAIFEGFNAGLWTTNSGRLLWMSHPAWPSADFQIYSWDYDTHAAFYGTKKGAEPVHVQMNLPDHAILMVNTAPRPLTGVEVRAHIVSLDNRPLLDRVARLDVPANGTATALRLDLAPALATGPVLVRLEARDAAGARIADNFYWQAATPAGLRPLTALKPATVTATVAPDPAPAAGDQPERALRITLANDGAVPALLAKLTAFDAAGAQILPAYFSDNYVSLLPGERRTVTLRYPAARGTATLRLRGWNIADQPLR
ncbi:glycosyl hydrolase 2 galactose-binding domain-containing protein [Sphingomonas morindae]|uniref:Glycoside hydrolase family 2 n=1 Tax=Sphingomonas morindae TaxID=1541170 RepID=A0ABY4XD02_9SPHN|nr:LamG-like jellyroll fold domain-containing protein [Sphingomonas morindae]USI74851.1 glycoside hydrolase family 2 [Sphingomonas morindae]